MKKQENGEEKPSENTQKSKFKVGDRVVWTNPYSGKVCYATVLRWKGSHLICNNWSDDPEFPEGTATSEASNFRHLTKLEKILK